MVLPKFAMVRFRRSVMFTNRFSFKKSISKLDTSLPFHIVYIPLNMLSLFRILTFKNLGRIVNGNTCTHQLMLIPAIRGPRSWICPKTLLV